MRSTASVRFCLWRTGPSARSALFPYTTLFRSHCLAFLPDDGGCSVALRRRVPPSALRTLRAAGRREEPRDLGDRKSTRLNSSHVEISYAVFCLKKKTRARDVCARHGPPGLDRG